MPRRPSKKEVKKALQDTAAEMIADYRGDEIERYQDIEKMYRKVQDEVWDRFKDKPIFKSIQDKWDEADMGMYFKEIHYTDEEENFMEKDPDYMEWVRLSTEEQEALDEEMRSFAERIKKGTLTPDEQDVVENAEITVWDSGKDWHGEGGLVWPMITMDGTFYEVMKYDIGSSTHTHWHCRFDYRLDKLGCYMEPFWAGVYDVVCEDEKAPAKGFKEKYLKENSYCEGHLEGIR